MAKIISVHPAITPKRGFKPGDLVEVNHPDYKGIGLVTYVRSSGNGISLVGLEPPSYLSTIDPKYITKLRDRTRVILEQRLDALDGDDDV